MAKKTLLIAPLALVVLLVMGVTVLRSGVGPVHQDSLSQPRIYAYRDWQSVGVQVHQGDRIYIRAQGTWLYTPGEFHGPQGHAKYRAPNTYPIPGIAGGILLGRIGKAGRAFRIGRGGTFYADSDGMLALRINDDILSDNKGYVTVEIEVIPPEDED